MRVRTLKQSVRLGCIGVEKFVHEHDGAPEGAWANSARPPMTRFRKGAHHISDLEEQPRGDRPIARDKCDRRVGGGPLWQLLPMSTRTE